MVTSCVSVTSPSLLDFVVIEHFAINYKGHNISLLMLDNTQVSRIVFYVHGHTHTHLVVTEAEKATES